MSTLGTVTACFNCESASLATRAVPLKVKRRPKFGMGWLLVTFFTMGLGLVLYVVWPRHNVTVGMDRYFQCQQCGARQPG